MFDFNDVKPKNSEKVNPIDQIKMLVDGGEWMKIHTKIMRGSKGSGNAYLLGEIKGIEVFRLECGNVKEWASPDELNIYVFALMEQISEGMAAYVAENKARAAALMAEQRAKREDHVSAVKVELANCKTPAEFRKVLRSHGLHPEKLDKIANKIESLTHAVEDVFAEYIGGGI